MKPEQVPQEWVDWGMKAHTLFPRAPRIPMPPYPASDDARKLLVREILAAVAPLIAAQEREQVVLLLEVAAERVAPTGKRSNHIDRHVADVLRDKAAAIRALGDATDTAPAPTRNAAHLENAASPRPR